jgi:hypothetical protein
MYSRLHLQGLGGFGGVWYWSSSQGNPSYAGYINFDNGDVGNYSKFDGYGTVRAVRAF